MNPPLISYEDFELPFLVEQEEQLDDDANDDLSQSEVLEQMQGQIPEDVLFLGQLSNEIAHSPGLSWATQDYYYVTPWKGEEYDWAMFRISWDDNWGRYEWTSDVRIRGVSDYDEAARQMFKGLMDRWGHDLSDDEHAPYKAFLDDIGA
jgi:hypothetical protein